MLSKISPFLGKIHSSAMDTHLSIIFCFSSTKLTMRFLSFKLNMFRTSSKKYLRSNLSRYQWIYSQIFLCIWKLEDRWKFQWGQRMWLESPMPLRLAALQYLPRRQILNGRHQNWGWLLPLQALIHSLAGLHWITNNLDLVRLRISLSTRVNTMQSLKSINIQPYWSHKRQITTTTPSMCQD
jgi:hypothetical protein